MSLSPDIIFCSPGSVANELRPPAWSERYNEFFHTSSSEVLPATDKELAELFVKFLDWVLKILERWEQHAPE